MHMKVSRWSYKSVSARQVPVSYFEVFIGEHTVVLENVFIYREKVSMILTMNAKKNRYSKEKKCKYNIRSGQSINPFG